MLNLSYLLQHIFEKLLFLCKHDHFVHGKTFYWIVVVVVAAVAAAAVVVVVAAVVYPFVPLETYSMWEASRSDPVARQLRVLPHFPASSNTVLFQACFGLPLLLGPCGFQFND